MLTLLFIIFHYCYISLFLSLSILFFRKQTLFFYFYTLSNYCLNLCFAVRRSDYPCSGNPFHNSFRLERDFPGNGRNFAPACTKGLPRKHGGSAPLCFISGSAGVRLCGRRGSGPRSSAALLRWDVVFLGYANKGVVKARTLLTSPLDDHP